MMVRYLVSVGLVFSLIACGNPAKDHFLDYVNNAAAGFAKTEAALIADYDKVRDSDDDLKILTGLMDRVIPACNKLSEEVTSYKPQNEDIRALHEILIKVNNQRCGAFLLLADGLNKQDIGIVQRANEKLDEVAKLVRDYQSQANILAKKLNVKFVVSSQAAPPAPSPAQNSNPTPATSTNSQARVQQPSSSDRSDSFQGVLVSAIPQRDLSIQVNFKRNDGSVTEVWISPENAKLAEALEAKLKGKEGSKFNIKVNDEEKTTLFLLDVNIVQ